MGTRRTWGTAVIAVAAGVAAALLPAPASGVIGAIGTVDREDQVVKFAADVFVQGADSQLENPTPSTDPTAPLYNIAGTSLNRTWGQFRAASATSRMRQTSGPKAHTDVTIEMWGLIPRGVYSVFYVTFDPDTRNKLCPSAERGIALKDPTPRANAPDASSFIADATGRATFDGRASGRLLNATIVDLIVIYHFDGKTYGALANQGEWATQGPDCRSSYGADAMRQLVIVQKQPG
jgi:hypothetical protein